MSDERRPHASVIQFPDLALRRALTALRDADASEIERSLAVSVLSLARQRGVGVPRWAHAIVDAAHRRSR